jgi:hypothetical protein
VARDPIFVAAKVRTTVLGPSLMLTAGEIALWNDEQAYRPGLLLIIVLKS